MVVMLSKVDSPCVQLFLLLSIGSCEGLLTTDGMWQSAESVLVKKCTAGDCEFSAILKADDKEQ